MFSAQIARAGREELPSESAAGFASYFGRWRLAPADRYVVHYQDGDLNASQVGQKVKQYSWSFPRGMFVLATRQDRGVCRDPMPPSITINAVGPTTSGRVHSYRRAWRTISLGPKYEADFNQPPGWIGCSRRCRIGPSRLWSRNSTKGRRRRARRKPNNSFSLPAYWFSLISDWMNGHTASAITAAPLALGWPMPCGIA
jgi:hypothetical protein